MFQSLQFFNYFDKLVLGEKNMVKLKTSSFFLLNVIVLNFLLNSTLGTKIVQLKNLALILLKYINMEIKRDQE